MMSEVAISAGFVVATRLRIDELNLQSEFIITSVS